MVLDGTRALEYLHTRGLKDPTLEAWHIGYVAQAARLPSAEWGFPPDREVYAPRGVLIPWFTSNGSLAGLKIRKPVTDHRAQQVRQHHGFNLSAVRHAHAGRRPAANPD